MPDVALRYDAGRGHGWDSFLLQRTRDREMLENRALDTLIFVETVHRWDLDVQNGSYQVAVASGDPSEERGPQCVLIEGQAVIDGEVSAAGVFLQRPLCSDVEDGNVTVEIGGLPTSTVIHYVLVSPAECVAGTVIDGDYAVPALTGSLERPVRDLQARGGSQGG